MPSAPFSGVLDVADAWTWAVLALSMTSCSCVSIRSKRLFVLSSSLSTSKFFAQLYLGHDGYSCVAVLTLVARRGLGGLAMRRTMLVRQSALYSKQFEHSGSSMSHLIFLVKHKSQAVFIVSGGNGETGYKWVWYHPCGEPGAVHRTKTSEGSLINECFDRREEYPIHEEE